MKKSRTSSKTVRKDLNGLAASQGGYFTAAQAKNMGYDRRRLAYHVAAGNFERAAHGLYRVPTIPASQDDELIRLSLWSRDHRDQPQAVVSHETALGLHGLGELIPSHTHLSVPKRFRKRAPAGIVLHASVLSSDDWSEHEGFRVTTPLRTLLDVATSKTVSQEQLDKAVAQALERGLVRRKQLLSAMRGHPGESRLSHGMETRR